MAEPPPRVSVVVPAYNRACLLGATIDSVLAQTVSSWELVVVDDGSTDATAQVAADYARADRRIRYVSGPNRGVAHARNRGLATTDARSEFVIMLDSDDLWTADALSVMTATLDRDHGSVAVHGVACCIDDGGAQPTDDDLADWMRARTALRDGALVAVGLDEPTRFDSLIVENWIVTPGTMLIRRNALAQAGPFDASLAPADDWEFAVRLSMYGDVTFLDHQVLWWRRHPGTLSETSSDWRRAYFRARDKLVMSPTATRPQLANARTAYRRVNWSSWHAASAALRRKDVLTALRSAARALDGNARYWRAVTIGALRRRR